MKILEKLRLAGGAGASGFSGMWAPIRFRPDPFTGEVLNIGIVIADERGAIRKVRILNSLARLKCLYGDRLREEQMDFILDVTKEALETNRETDCRVPVEGVRLGDFMPVSDASAEDAANNLFYEVVPLAAPRREEQEDEQEDQSDAIAAVKMEVKSRNPALEKYFDTRISLGRGRDYRFSFTGRRAAINMSKLYYGSNLSTYADKAKARILDLAHLRKHDQSHLIETETGSGRQHYDLLVFHDDFESPRLTKRNAQTLRDTLHQLEDEADKAEVRLRPAIHVAEAVDWIIQREAA